MIDPDCKVCLGVGWVCENHRQRAWTEELGYSVALECRVNAFALTGLEEPDVSQALKERTSARH